MGSLLKVLRDQLPAPCGVKPFRNCFTSQQFFALFQTDNVSIWEIVCKPLLMLDMRLQHAVQQLA